MKVTEQMKREAIRTAAAKMSYSRLPQRDRVRKAHVDVPVEYQINHSQARVIGQPTSGEFGLAQVMVEAPASLTVYGATTNFKMTYAVPYSVTGELDPKAAEWGTTTLPPLLETLFEAALKATGVVRSVGKKLFH